MRSKKKKKPSNVLRFDPNIRSSPTRSAEPCPQMMPQRKPIKFPAKLGIKHDEIVTIIYLRMEIGPLRQLQQRLERLERSLARRLRAGALVEGNPHATAVARRLIIR